MADRTHDRLTRGDFQYHSDGAAECSECVRPPAVKIMLDDENEVQGIARTFFCEGKPVNFSIGVQVLSRPRKAFVYAIRACSSHANYHVHWWHHLRVKETSVVEKFRLNTQGDVTKAHVDATVNIFPRSEEWRKKWAAKKS